jgi:hypothetical protein
MRCLAQTVHLYCTDANTTSRRTEMRFHMTHVTYEFHQVHPKWVLNLWYVRRKPCTNLVSRLALSPNELNWASTRASLPRSATECVQNVFRANGMFGTNRAPFLLWHKHCLQTDRNKTTHDPHHQVVPLGAYKMIFEPLVHSAQTMHLSCIKITTVSKWTEPSFHLCHIT